jgi:hypothetical protein
LAVLAEKREERDGSKFLEKRTNGILSMCPAINL